LSIDFSLGSSSSISLPYTPTRSGLLFVTGTATTENNSYLSISNGFGNQTCFIPHNGWSGQLIILVFKGKTISHANASLGNTSYIFRPFIN